MSTKQEISYRPATVDEKDSPEARDAAAGYNRALDAFTAAGNDEVKASAELSEVAANYAAGRSPWRAVKPKLATVAAAVEETERAELALLDSLGGLAAAMATSVKRRQAAGHRAFEAATAKRDDQLKRAGMTGQALEMAKRSPTKDMIEAAGKTACKWRPPVDAPRKNTWGDPDRHLFEAVEARAAELVELRRARVEKALEYAH